MSLRDRLQRPRSRCRRGLRWQSIESNRCEGLRVDTHLLLQLVVNGLVVRASYGAVSLCFVLIYKASRVVNFAQGDFLLIGAWTCWWLLTKYQLPFAIGFLVTLVFMLVFGFVLQVVVLRPMIGEPVISV